MPNDARRQDLITVTLTLAFVLPTLVVAWIVSPQTPPAHAGGTFSQLWDAARGVVSTLGSLCLSGLTSYFLWRRLRTKILITCSTRHELIGDGRVDSITLINRGDRPLTIFSLQGVDEGKVFEIESFKEPKLVKPLESLFISTSRFSAYKGYELRASKGPRYYALLEDRAVECELINSPQVENFKTFEGLTVAGKVRLVFNEKLYDEGTRFAVVYRKDGVEQTALILVNGIVVEDWPFTLNRFKSEQLGSAATLHATIQSIPMLAKGLGRYGIFDFEVHDFAKLDWGT